MDLEDSRYLFRFRWVDVDIAKGYFPGSEAAIDAAAACTDDERDMDWWLGRRTEEWGDTTPVLPRRCTMYDWAACPSSEERREGKGVVSRCRSRGWPHN